MSEVFSFKSCMQNIDLFLIMACSLLVISVCATVYVPSDMVVSASFTLLNVAIVLLGIVLLYIVMNELIDIVKIISLIRHKLDFIVDINNWSLMKLILVLIFVIVIPLFSRIIYTNNVELITDEMMIFIMNNSVILEIVFAVVVALLIFKTILCLIYGKVDKTSGSILF